MSEVWWWLLAACAVAYLTKLSGYLLPADWLDQPWVRTVSTGMTAGLLASLVVTNAFVTGQTLVLDARVAALAAGAVALWLRAPYLVVVLVGAVAAALARLAGL
ncbi:MAG: AzlD domain-containing protein [Propionibacteriaceae bacterium]|nr:AzlD domain-containing protein [Propionibacteriaceae bacterium]